MIVLLVDERPEEATAWREALPVAEFAIATADLAPIEQLRTAELALERARRVAETGGDAVLICDSLSRLAARRGRHGRGQAPLRLRSQPRRRRLADRARHGARRRSRRGEAVRAVTTTESSLVVLDPELAAAGVTPAIRAAECRVSNEDELREPAELEAVAQAARRARRPRARARRPTLLRERIEGSATNAELLGRSRSSAGRRGRPRTARARARSAPRRDPAGRSRRCGCRRRRRRRARPP